MDSEVIKVEVIQEETIRPFTPTPHQLRSCSLSVFDQLVPEAYAPFLFFYPTKHSTDEVNNIDLHTMVSERSKIIKESLSRTLTRFYPFAGKVQNNASICCNDHGAVFLEAQVNCPISKILDKPDLGMLKQLLPADQATTQAEAGYLLLVQANFFECGGLVIGISISHKIIDGYTLTTFINSWAAVALNGGGSTTADHVLLPADFDVAPSLFPPLDSLNTPRPVAVEFKAIRNCTTRRFVFGASMIAALRSKAASATVPNPTRVEVVSALIWKCAMEASRSNLGFRKPSVWFQMVNMRHIFGKSSVENLFGNLVGQFPTWTEESEADDAVQSLVTKLRKGMEEFKVNYGNNGVFNGEDACEMFKKYASFMKRGDVETYSCSSLCRFPFYGPNFGWGKPSWVSQCVQFKNMIMLIDNRDGNDIEAYLTLKEEDMAKVESNMELHVYASLNPSVT